MKATTVLSAYAEARERYVYANDRYRLDARDKAERQEQRFKAWLEKRLVAVRGNSPCVAMYKDGCPFQVIPYPYDLYK